MVKVGKNFHNSEKDMFTIHILGKQVPAFHNARISVRLDLKKPKEVQTMAKSIIRTESSPKLQDSPETTPSK